MSLRYLTVVEHFFEDIPSGSARVAWDIAMEMRDRGYEVTVLCYRAGDNAPGLSEYEGVRLVRFDKEGKPCWHPGRLQAIIESTARACRQWLSDCRWDIVHVHSCLMGLGAVSCFGSGPRYVFTVHSPLVLEQEIKAIPFLRLLGCFSL